MINTNQFNRQNSSPCVGMEDITEIKSPSFKESKKSYKAEIDLRSDSKASEDIEIVSNQLSAKKLDPPSSNRRVSAQSESLTFKNKENMK